MDLEVSSQWLDKIGAKLVEEVSSPSNNVLAFFEAEEACLTSAIYSDQIDRFVFADVSDDLVTLVMDFWDAEDLENRWATLCYVLRGAEIEVDFTFPEQLVEGEDHDVRRERALKAAFGDKPIEYPPIGPDAVELDLSADNVIVWRED